MRVTDSLFVILRYLEWDRPLQAHPDYSRIRHDTVVSRKRLPGMKNYLADSGRSDLEELYRRLFLGWPDLVKAFAFRVELITIPFFRAELQAREILLSLSGEDLAQTVGGRTFMGTLLFPHLRSSVSYSLSFDESGTLSGWRILQLSDGECITLYADGEFLFVTDDRHFCDPVTGREVSVEHTMDESLMFLDSVLELLRVHVLFKRLADVKEKRLPVEGTREARRCDPSGDDVSAVRIPVRRMDVTYFTTYVRTEGYPRRGFFRRQRYKRNGEWQIRIQWIDATYVSGYTRKARKLVEIQ